MNDADITKLAAKLTVSLATKDDIKMLEGKIDSTNSKLGKKIDILDKKIDKVLEYAQAIDETVGKHEKRLRNIERIPIIAHELKKPAQIIKS